jgi:hypothetical protein
MVIRLVVLLAPLIAIAACESPEATRTRGGGPGGDSGNRPATVTMHEGSLQYWETRKLIPGDSVSLQTASHARESGRP